MNKYLELSILFSADLGQRVDSRFSRLAWAVVPVRHKTRIVKRTSLLLQYYVGAGASI